MHSDDSLCSAAFNWCFMLRKRALLPLLAAIAVHSPGVVGAAEECRLNKVASVDLTISDSQIYVPVVLGEHAVLMALNTQSGLSIVSDGSAAKYGLPRANLPQGMKMTFSKHSLSQYATIRPVPTKGLNINNTRIRLVPGKEGCALRIHSTDDDAAQYVDCMGSEPPLLVGMNKYSSNCICTWPPRRICCTYRWPMRRPDGHEGAVRSEA